MKYAKIITPTQRWEGININKYTFTQICKQINQKDHEREPRSTVVPDYFHNSGSVKKNSGGEAVEIATS